MPQALNRITGDQWDGCDRCGRWFPVGELQKQKGLLLCKQDTDNLTVERRPVEIMRVLEAPGAEEEGSDRRVFNRSFFQGYDTEVY